MSAAPSRVIHHDLAHGGGCEGEEVLAVVHREASLVEELEICLVDDGRGAQRLIGAARADGTPCDAAQLVVDERKELTQGFAPALTQ